MFNNRGDMVSQTAMPTDEIGRVKGDGYGYGYDIGINTAKNMMLTSSFTGWNNCMMDLGKLVKDGEAMKRFGNTMVAWDVK
jgi:selenium-binding protein 1